MLSRCEVALAEVAEDLRTQDQLVRLHNCLQPQSLCQGLARLVELGPPLAVVRSIGHQYAKIPQIHPVEGFFVMPRCVGHLHEVDGGFILSPHASQSGTHVPVQGLVELRRAWLFDGEIGQRLDLIHHLHRLDIAALLHPNLGHVVQVLDHPRAAPKLRVPRAPQEHGLCFVQLVVLFVGSREVDRIPKDGAVREAAARAPQHAHEL
mmetsp:Transcript_85525/g.264816  ORF Transcript_85525/g.264816 Transcript_85525/m.264816 type:complete len:207 (-) Transcript_85525:105-725(-)